MEKAERGATLRAARVVDGALGAPTDVASDGDMFVNWADMPTVTFVSDNHWFAHWLRYNADATYAYDVVVAQTFDAGASWSEPLTVHSDGTHTEHGFVSMYAREDGMSLTWLDGRNTPAGPMTLRSATVTPDGSLLDEHEVDDSVCDCCQTSVAVSSNAPLIVYRDRTEDEIRDIYITRHDGQRWLAGTRLFADDWRIAGCPVNGPSIVADGDLVAVAWFSAANDKPVVRVVLSTTGGLSFGAPVEIATGRVAGYVGLGILDSRHVAVSWVQRSASGDNAVMIRSVDVAGVASPPVHVGDTRQLRVFPQIAVSGDQVIVVWTNEADSQQVMRAAIAPWLAP